MSYWPAGQLEQKLEPSEEELPKEHRVQVQEEVAAVAVEYMPTEHLVQLPAAVPDWY